MQLVSGILIKVFRFLSLLYFRLFPPKVLSYYLRVPSKPKYIKGTSMTYFYVVFDNPEKGITPGFLDKIYNTLHTIKNFNELESKTVYITAQNRGQIVAVGPSFPFLEGKYTKKEFRDFYLKYLTISAKADSNIIKEDAEIIVVTVRKLEKLNEKI